MNCTRQMTGAFRSSEWKWNLSPQSHICVGNSLMRRRNQLRNRFSFYVFRLGARRNHRYRVSAASMAALKRKSGTLKVRFCSAVSYLNPMCLTLYVETERCASKLRFITVSSQRFWMAFLCRPERSESSRFLVEVPVSKGRYQAGSFDYKMTKWDLYNHWLACLPTRKSIEVRITCKSVRTSLKLHIK
jgi:hypothetical protein